MIYSVWNNASRLYDVYETSEVRPIHAEGAGRTSGRAMGATPEESAYRLPAGARKTGTSALPRGRVASIGGSPGALGLFDEGWPSWWPVAAVAAAYAIWRMR